MKSTQVWAAGVGLALLAAMGLLLVLGVQHPTPYWVLGAGVVLCVIFCREADNTLGRTVRGVFGGALLVGGAFAIYLLATEPWTVRRALLAAFGVIWGGLQLLWAVAPGRRSGEPDVGTP